MTAWLDRISRSGTNEHCHLTADTERELEDMERRLGVEVRGKGQQEPHLDLNRHKRDLAIRYGAQEKED